MFHFRRERSHHGGEPLAAIIDLRDIGVGLAGQMDELHFLAVVVPHRQGLEDELVDAVRALAAAHDEDDGQRGIQPEFFRRDRAVDPRQAAPHRRSGHHAMGLAQIIRATLETEQRLVHPWRDDPRHASRDRVRFVNERRQMEAAPQQQRDGAGKAAHAHHRGRLKIAIDPAALAPAAQEAQAKCENAGRENARPADARQRVRLLLLRAFKRDGVDLFGRNQQQGVVPALAQFLRDGQSRKEMTAGSPASNGNFHRCFSGLHSHTIRHRRQRRGGLRLVDPLPVHVEEDADRGQAGQQIRAAVADKGKGNALGGMSEVTTARFINAWSAIITVSPVPKRTPAGSGA